MAGVALAFAVLEVSNSATALGTVLAARSIPLVVFLLVGGVIADRFGRTLSSRSPTSSRVLSARDRGPGHLRPGRGVAAHHPVRRPRHGQLGELPGDGQRAAAAGPPRAAQAGQPPPLGPAQRADRDRSRGGRPPGRHRRCRLGAGRRRRDLPPRRSAAPEGPDPASRAPRGAAERSRRAPGGVDLLPKHRVALGDRARLRSPQHDPGRCPAHPGTGARQGLRPRRGRMGADPVRRGTGLPGLLAGVDRDCP